MPSSTLSKEGSITSQLTKSEFNSEFGSFQPSLLPQLVTQEDVVTNFFNQMIEMIIEDMIIVQSEEPIIREASTASQIITKHYQDLQTDDLNHSKIISIEGSSVTLKKRKSSATASIKSKQSKKLSDINEESVQNSTIFTEASSLRDPLMEEERQVKILFVNGNTYEGRIAKRIMNGKGKYTWADGTIYHGNFKDGFPTGLGEMTLPDLSHYKGGFNQGLFHGEGYLNIVGTPTFYNGQWKDGLKHGQGWLLYQPKDWYEGGWSKDLKDGYGIRYYLTGAKYRGNWSKGKFHGEGIMIWENNDYYKGEWDDGHMHGYGEYIWKAFYNKTFAFPIQNIYKGNWLKSKRNGEGVMIFGSDSGARFKGNWQQDFKHGFGVLICGNGKILEHEKLFTNDKPTIVNEKSINDFPPIPNFYETPIFAIPEMVDVGFYVDKLLEKIGEINEEKIKILKLYEERSIKNLIINFLPQLNELYQHYATLTTVKEDLKYQPVMVRMFLWQMYQDMGIEKYELSLIEIDRILAENPQSCLETTHYPFEHIYFWQFLMSLIGTCLTVTSLDQVFDYESNQSSVSAFIIKKFFEETVFAQPLTKKGSYLFTYMDQVPIKSMYSMYQNLGEPHTAKQFLKQTCTKRGEIPILCYLELHPHELTVKFGANVVALAEHIHFRKQKSTTRLEDEESHCWTSLYDFRRLGARNIVQCLAKICPLIIQEGVVTNMDYELTFLEFYQTLLECIFLVLQLEMNKKKKILVKSISPPPEPTPVITKRQKSAKSETEKKPSKTKGKKKKSKDKL